MVAVYSTETGWIGDARLAYGLNSLFLGQSQHPDEWRETL